MCYEFEYLMHLLGAACAGSPLCPPERALDWEKLLSLTKEQQLTTVIAGVLKEAGCPETLRKPIADQSFSAVLTDCARRGNVIALLEQMHQQGMQSYVVKGMAAARNYAAPENRISSDTDICIDPAQEEQVCDFLKSFGCAVSPRWENGHHAVARHPKLGIVEVHVRLYDEMVEDVWFRDLDQTLLIREKRQRIETDDGAYETLGPTDHLIFMALHMVKHFINCGMSLRMMMDVALQIKNYQKELDFGRFRKVLESLHYGAAVDTVLWAMIRYCGFSEEDFPGLPACREQQLQDLLADVESGGWLGKNNEEVRKQSGYAYNRHLLMKKKSKWQYWLYMIQWQHSFRITTLFPGKRRLARHYPFVEKHPWLIPAAWLHRLVFRGFALLKSGSLTKPIVNDEKEISTASRDRLRLFRELEML